MNVVPIESLRLCMISYKPADTFPWIFQRQKTFSWANIFISNANALTSSILWTFERIVFDTGNKAFVVTSIIVCPLLFIPIICCFFLNDGLLDPPRAVYEKAEHWFITSDADQLLQKRFGSASLLWLNILSCSKCVHLIYCCYENRIFARKYSLLRKKKR